MKACVRSAVLCIWVLFVGCGRYPEGTILIEANAESDIPAVRRIVVNAGFVGEVPFDPNVRKWTYFGGDIGHAYATTLLSPSPGAPEILATIYLGEDKRRIIITIVQRTVLQRGLRVSVREAIANITDQARREFGFNQVTVVQK